MLFSSDTTHPSGSIPPINLAQVFRAKRAVTVFRSASKQALEAEQGDGEAEDREAGEAEWPPDDGILNRGDMPAAG